MTPASGYQFAQLSQKELHAYSATVKMALHAKVKGGDKGARDKTPDSDYISSLDWKGQTGWQGIKKKQEPESENQANGEHCVGVSVQ